MKKAIFILILNSIVTLAYCQKNNTVQTDSTKSFVLGVVDEIQSTILAEKRVLNIYLPEGYSKNDTVQYPVIYLLDGSADEDFIHIVGLVQFCSFDWIKQLPRSIVVGIANIDRKRDFTFPTSLEAEKKRYPTTGQSGKFIQFIEKELQPFIARKYKTNASKTIIGQSLGGLLAAEILFKKSALFTKYIIVSPSLWWDNGSILNLSAEIFKDTFSQQLDIYIAVGKEGLTPSDFPRVMEVDVNLMAEKLQSTKSKSITTYFDYLPDKDHSNIMHQAVLNAFKLFSSKK